MTEVSETGLLNRNQIKYIVAAAMLIDHIALGFVDERNLLPCGFMHLIGRLTGATMAYFVGEGYRYTKNVSRYQLRLGIFAIISWIPFAYFEGGYLPFDGEDFVGAILLQSVIFTLFLGLTAIRVWESPKFKKPVKVILVILLCVISVFGDWPVMDVLAVLFVHVFRDNPKKKWTAFTLTYLIPNTLMIVCYTVMFGAEGFENSWYQLGVLLVPIMLRFLYNGEGGSKAAFHKWFFYVFYPLHLLILGFIRWGILG